MKNLDAIKTDRAEETNTSGVFSAVEKASKGKRQAIASPAEQAERRKNMTTQGKRGCKLPRIYCSFSQPNYDYVHVMAALNGESITRFINEVLDADRERNADIYAQAQQLAEGIKK